MPSERYDFKPSHGSDPVVTIQVALQFTITGGDPHEPTAHRIAAPHRLVLSAQIDILPAASKQ